MLQVDNIEVRYGGIRALGGVSFAVAKGEVLALLGANGAGKSTTLRAISGMVPLAGGRILFMDEATAGVSTENLARRGLAHVPEGRRVFAGLTVLENLEVALPKKLRSQESQMRLSRVFDLFPRLAERRRQLGWSLSGGEQQMLAVGRALMGRPQLLMLDEPSLGLAPILVEALFAALAAIVREGTTILLVEQNAHLALTLAGRAVVLRQGRVVMSGSAAELRAGPNLLHAYLGRRTGFSSSEGVTKGL